MYIDALVTLVQWLLAHQYNVRLLDGGHWRQIRAAGVRSRAPQSLKGGW